MWQRATGILWAADAGMLAGMLRERKKDAVVPERRYPY